MKTAVVLGNQLFPIKKLRDLKIEQVFMAEDHELCTYFKFHKHKIIFFLAAMRQYAEELEESGIKVVYKSLKSKGKDKKYETKLKEFTDEAQLRELHVFEIEDKCFEKRIIEFCSQEKLEIQWHKSPMFVVERSKFKEYLKNHKKPFMKTFYESIRKETGVLMQKNGKPRGGRFSFDSDNRKKMPKGETPPALPVSKANKCVQEVKQLVEERFSDHPGSSQNFWLPTTRKEALRWKRAFVQERLSKFGDYQDAISPDHEFNYHSVLSPMINSGLLLPDEVIQSVEQELTSNNINSVEGFIRQVLGWREFIRGIYQNYSEQQEKENFFNHQRKLNKHWYDATTGIPVLDDCIKKANKYSYNHHIERLMIVSNIMLMLQVHPHEVHRWFMEMFADSSDWVMGPNVYGMGQFSDGGIFATKPYLSSSNYLLKMSSYKKGDWCDVIDGLFWRFLDKNRKFFQTQYRMAGLLTTLDKMDKSRKSHIFRAAQGFQKKVTAEK